jgi:hypothetical protein
MNWRLTAAIPDAPAMKNLVSEFSDELNNVLKVYIYVNRQK